MCLESSRFEKQITGGAASDWVRPYHVAPDGRILAIKEDDSVRSDHIVVVQNCLTEARALLATPRK